MTLTREQVAAIIAERFGDRPATYRDGRTMTQVRDDLTAALHTGKQHTHGQQHPAGRTPSGTTHDPLGVEPATEPGTDV